MPSVLSQVSQCIRAISFKSGQLENCLLTLPTGKLDKSISVKLFKGEEFLMFVIIMPQKPVFHVIYYLYTLEGPGWVILKTVKMVEMPAILSAQGLAL